MNGAILWLLFAPLAAVSACIVAVAAERKNPAVWCGLMVRLSNLAMDVSWWFVRLGESCDAFAARWCELRRLEREESRATKQFKILLPGAGRPASTRPDF